MAHLGDHGGHWPSNEAPQHVVSLGAPGRAPHTSQVKGHLGFSCREGRVGLSWPWV